MLLDLLTVFFLVAGCTVLWLNLRRRRIAITKTDDAHQSVPTGAFRMMLKSAPCLRRLNPLHQRPRATRKQRQARILSGYSKATVYNEHITARPLSRALSLARAVWLIKDGAFGGGQCAIHLGRRWQ